MHCVGVFISYYCSIRMTRHNLVHLTGCLAHEFGVVCFSIVYLGMHFGAMLFSLVYFVMQFGVVL